MVSSLPAVGLLSWIVAGLAVGLIAPRFVPRAVVGRMPAACISLLGGLGGGLLATALGFGGLESFDPRSALIAALAALLLLLATEVAAGRGSG